jgi:hypothetical protein
LTCFIGNMRQLFKGEDFEIGYFLPDFHNANCLKC